MKSVTKNVTGTIALVLLLAGNLPAGTVIMSARLDGRHEFPSNGSAGTGEATITLNDATGAVSVAGTYRGLGSEAVAAHIHGLAPEGENAGVIVPLTISGGTDGTVSGSGTLSAAQIQGMLDGLTYVNVHSKNLGGGEIRGQIKSSAPVPMLPYWGLPALAVLLAGGAALLLLRRRSIRAAA